MGALRISSAVVLATAFCVMAFLPVGSDGMQVEPRTVDGMTVVVLTGTPEERGLSYGSAVGPLIADNLELFWEEAEEKGIQRAEMAARALTSAPALPEHMLTELTAMAESSGVNYAELLAMNMYGSSVRGHDGCTIFAAAGSGSETGNTIASKNRDANCPNILLVVEPLEDKHGFVAVTGAGDWGISFGLSDVGLCDGNNWMPVPGYYEGGLGELTLNRLVLEDCGSVDESIDYVSSVKKYGGTTVMVADSESAAFIEAVPSCYSTPDGKDTLFEKIVDGAGVHTNHYTLEPFKSWVMYDAFGYFWVPSVARYDRGVDLLSMDGGSVAPTDVIGYTRDLYNFGNSQPMEIIDAHPEIPRHAWEFGWPGFSICNSRTVSAGVFEIDADWPEYLSTMWTSINSPCFTPYFPLHNGVIGCPDIVRDGLSAYVDGTVWKVVDVLRESGVYAWGDLVLVFEEWESLTALENEAAVAEARALLVGGSVDDACACLAENDVALGLEAYELITSIEL